MLFVGEGTVADRGLLAELVRAYEAHPEVGSIGGVVNLQQPEPRPWWYGPQMREYWSGFTGESDLFYHCTSWRHYPPCAFWSSKRDLLIQIGGFRSRHAKATPDSSIGESTVAMLGIEGLGHKIAITPAAQVQRTLPRHRFTLNTVFRTTTTNYGAIARMVLEQYIYRHMGNAGGFTRATVQLLRALLPWPMPVAERVHRVARAAGMFYGGWRMATWFLLRTGQSPSAIMSSLSHAGKSTRTGNH